MSERLRLPPPTASHWAQAVDGRLLCTLSDDDLEHDLGVRSKLHRRKLLLEIDALCAVAPPPPLPPPVRRDPSEPTRGHVLEEVTEPLELRHLRDHVLRSCRDARAADAFDVVRAHRIHNPYLAYKLEATSRTLLAPGANRAVPPQGGYFHGTDEEATLSICEHGFDDRRWKGGKFGVGQYLSVDASKAVRAAARI